MKSSAATANSPFQPPRSARFLLLQMRNAADQMRANEVACFARSLNLDTARITTFDLLTESLSAKHLNSCDMLLLGGAGEYSVTADAEWLERALDSLRLMHTSGRPAFASCWGFQAMARAMGGRVINDVDNAEVGVHAVSLTAEGRDDQLFGQLPSRFAALMGHEDHVVELPPGTIRLADSDRVKIQAYRFADAPVYCTQFHPELTPDDLVLRVQAYPQYLERIAGVPLDEFVKTMRPTPESASLLLKFAKLVFG